MLNSTAVKPDRSHENLDEFLAEARSRQNNVLWPDTFTNGKLVTRLLFRGIENPTPVQRVGAWLFGLAYFGAGLVLVDAGRQTDTWEYKFIGLSVMLLGIWVFRNGFPKRRGE
jgi:hypothetical protein